MRTLRKSALKAANRRIWRRCDRTAAGRSMHRERESAALCAQSVAALDHGIAKRFG